MATYLELKQQADALLAEAEVLRKQEIAEVVQSIKAQMKEYGLTHLSVRLPLTRLQSGLDGGAVSCVPIRLSAPPPSRATD